MYNPADQKFANKGIEMIKTLTPEQKSEMLLDIFPEYTKAKEVLDYLIDVDDTLNKTVYGDYKINSLRKRFKDMKFTIPEDESCWMPHITGISITKYSDGKSYLTLAYMKNGIGLYDNIRYIGEAKRLSNPVYVFDKIADRLDFAERNWKKKEEEKEYKEAHADMINMKNKLDCYLNAFNICVPTNIEENKSLWEDSNIKTYTCSGSKVFNSLSIPTSSDIYKRASQDMKVAEKVIEVLTNHCDELKNIVDTIQAELSAI